MKKSMILLFVVTIFISACQSKNKTIEKPCCTNSEIIKHEKLKLPTESLYQLESKWQDQDEKSLTLNSLHGKVQIAAMIFSNCKLACPRIIVDLKAIESKLTREEKSKVIFLLISFDAERDTSAQLKKFAKEMHLNENWKLIHSTENNIREISMILDIKYEKQPDGTFSHSNAIHVVNQNGVIVHRQEGLGADNSATLVAISKTAKDIQ